MGCLKLREEGKQAEIVQ